MKFFSAFDTKNNTSCKKSNEKVDPINILDHQYVNQILKDNIDFSENAN
jgi:hypothetical protein